MGKDAANPDAAQELDELSLDEVDEEELDTIPPRAPVRTTKLGLPSPPKRPTVPQRPPRPILRSNSRVAGPTKPRLRPPAKPDRASSVKPQTKAVAPQTRVEPPPKAIKPQTRGEPQTKTEEPKMRRPLTWLGPAPEQLRSHLQRQKPPTDSQLDKPQTDKLKAQGPLPPPPDVVSYQTRPLDRLPAPPTFDPATDQAGAKGPPPLPNAPAGSPETGTAQSPQTFMPASTHQDAQRRDSEPPTERAPKTLVGSLPGLHPAPNKAAETPLAGPGTPLQADTPLAATRALPGLVGPALSRLRTSRIVRAGFIGFGAVALLLTVWIASRSSSPTIETPEVAIRAPARAAEPVRTPEVEATEPVPRATGSEDAVALEPINMDEPDPADAPNEARKDALNTKTPSPAAPAQAPSRAMTRATPSLPPRSTEPEKPTKTAANPPPAPSKPVNNPFKKNEPRPAPGTEPFSTQQAIGALNTAASQASGCRGPNDPTGTASVSVTFAPSGRATNATVNGPPFAGTTTGSCIAATFRRARVSPFAGEFTTVRKTMVIY